MMLVQTEEPIVNQQRPKKMRILLVGENLVDMENVLLARESTSHMKKKTGVVQTISIWSGPRLGT